MTIKVFLAHGRGRPRRSSLIPMISFKNPLLAISCPCSSSLHPLVRIDNLSASLDAGSRSVYTETRDKSRPQRFFLNSPESPCLPVKLIMTTMVAWASAFQPFSSSVFLHCSVSRVRTKNKLLQYCILTCMISNVVPRLRC